MTLSNFSLAAILLLGFFSFVLSVVAFIVSLVSLGQSSTPKPQASNTPHNDSADRYYWVGVKVIRNLSNMPETERADEPELTSGSYGIPVLSVGGKLNTFNLSQVLTAHFGTSMVGIMSLTEVDKNQNHSWPHVLTVPS